MPYASPPSTPPAGAGCEVLPPGLLECETWVNVTDPTPWPCPAFPSCCATPSGALYAQTYCKQWNETCFDVGPNQVSWGNGDVGSGLQLTWNRAIRKTMRELGIEHGWEPGCLVGLNRTAWKEKVGDHDKVT